MTLRILLPTSTTEDQASSGRDQMRKIPQRITLFIFCIIYSVKSEPVSRNENIIKNVLQRRLPPIIENYLERLLENIPTNMPSEQILKDDTSLTPAIIIKALENFRDVLPEKISMFPYAMAEPTTNNILVYLAIYNSSLVNLTRYNIDASVSDHGSRTTINISLGIDKSGLEGHYELDVSNYDLHLYGDGNYSITSNNTDISISVTVQINEDGSFLMSAFLIDLSINSTKIKLDNLLDGDPNVDPLLAFMGQMVPSDVEIVNSLFRDTVNATVVEFTNSYLTKFISWKYVVFLVKFLAGYYT